VQGAVTALYSLFLRIALIVEFTEPEFLEL